MKELDALFPSNWFSSWGSRVQTVSRACQQRTGPPTQHGSQQVNISGFDCVCVCVCLSSVWLPAFLSLYTARSLHEVALHESIRYAPGDAVEKWLNDLLCLDCLNIPRLISGCPLPQTCDLYPWSTSKDFGEIRESRKQIQSDTKWLSRRVSIKLVQTPALVKTNVFLWWRFSEHKHLELGCN